MALTSGCPLDADKKALFQLFASKRKDALLADLRKDVNAKTADLMARKMYNGGLRLGLEIDTAINTIIRTEQAKLEAMEEVIAATGGVWTREIGSWLKESIRVSFDEARERLLRTLKQGGCDLRVLPPERRMGPVIRAEHSLESKLGTILRDIAIHVAQAAVAKTEEKTVTQQQINISDSQIGQVNVAGGDLAASNQELVFDRAEALTLLSQIRSSLREADLSEPEETEAIQNVDRLATELEKPSPQAQSVLEYLGHIANIAAVTGLAHRLGDLLSNLVR